MAELKRSALPLVSLGHNQRVKINSSLAGISAQQSLRMVSKIVTRKGGDKLMNRRPREIKILTK